MRLRSNILKLCLFATGFSGIVAEYILATLATHFLGDSVFQWAMIVSVMLFSMGIGSRISKYLQNHLLQKFIYIEFTLSLFVGFSSMLVYISSVYTIYDGFVIYFLGIMIGIFIGMEIPLVIRLNDEFETLRVNVASVIEKDYFGSLAGGLFFSFFALPYLGLTYTPFVLGALNFLVAFILFIILRKHNEKRFNRILSFFSASVTLLLLLGVLLSKPIILFGEQKKYTDKIIFSKQSRYQNIVITQWKDNYWLYINGNQQLCSIDEVTYHEPLVHPAMKLSKTPYDVLVIGGGDGCAIREILKYNDVKAITLVDLDPVMTDLGQHHPVISKLNEGALNNPKVKILNMDGYNFLEDQELFFDVIIVDLPDPRTPELGRLYSLEFYKLCNKRLRPHGVMVTQAGSPYYATQAFQCIDLTIKAADFSTQPMHNQVLSFGEWGWVLGAKSIPQEELRAILLNLKFDDVKTNWLNSEAMHLITSFGKNIYPGVPADSVEINSIHNAVVYRYYLHGNWDLY